MNIGDKAPEILGQDENGNPCMDNNFLLLIRTFSFRKYNLEQVLQNLLQH